MFGMKNHFDISDSIEIHEVDIAGVACIQHVYKIIGDRLLNPSSLAFTLE